jgi:hypothetical protein
MKRVYTYSATVRAVQYNGALVLTVLLRVSWPWAGIASVIRSPDWVSPDFLRFCHFTSSLCNIYIYDTKRRSWVHKSHLSYPIQFTNVKSGAEWRRWLDTTDTWIKRKFLLPRL